MVNTEIFYMYRDADNYKQHESVVMYGVLCSADIDKIFSSLDDDGFVPSAVGLEDLQDRNVNGWQEDIDHPFHELLSIKTTKLKPTTSITVLDFLERFINCNWAEAALKIQSEHTDANDS